MALSASLSRTSSSRRASPSIVNSNSCFFFFQAEDGIRDLIVTGVQTCALPISVRHARGRRHLDRDHGGLAPSVQGLEGGEREHDEPVPGLPQDRALLRDDALDGDRKSVV